MILYKRLSYQQYSQGKNVFYSIQYKNDCLAAFDLFHMFTESIKLVIT